MNQPLQIINDWPDQPQFIACLASRIEQGMASFAGEEVTVVYSAHSLPVQFIREGDPYVDHLQRSIRSLESLTGIRGQLCYQSRSGPVEWLGPALPEVLRELAGQRKRNVLVVPISFVSDHVETLYEIDIEYRQLAEGLGLRFAVTRALNADPQFIAGLRSLVLGAVCG
jgi:ferrochelatase